VSKIYRVETAEFQMFTDITLDTGDEKSRRAFVDEKGKPVPAEKKQSQDADGKKSGNSGSAEFLGKKPEILLHGSGNWINGNNTGTTGKDKDGNKIPSGQFTPTAKIEKYKPEPKLGA
jgi:hypothetical protein